MSNKLMLISSEPAAISAEQLFRASCGTYLHLLDVLNFDIAHRQIVHKDIEARINELRNAEKGSVDALKAFVSGQPDEKVIMTYFTSAATFFGAWARCLHQGIDPLSPKFRRTVKSLFDTWKASEQAYGRAGYRTISFDDWNASMTDTDDDAIRPSAVHLMAIVRNKDEQAVHHAVATQRKYPKLKI